MRHYRLFLLTFILQLVYFLSPVAYADAQKPTVNILTWWGYLDDPGLIARTEKACDVKISHDVYYSNDEFLRRWRGSEDNYDILIFTESIYNSAAPHLPIIETPLWQEANDYNPVIKAHYFEKKFPPNVVYYAHALTGFLWNKPLVSINQNTSFQEIFSQSKGHTIALIDDPLEVKILLDTKGAHNTQSIDDSIHTFDNIETLLNNTKIIPINNYRQLSDHKDLALIFTWSGEAIRDVINNSNAWEFTINQNLSQISSDLLAQTSNSSASYCVAKHLTSKSEMNFMQNKEFYFSPYVDNSQVINKNFKKIYAQFISVLPTIKWLSTMDGDDLNKLNTAWAITKIRLTREINE